MTDNGFNRRDFLRGATLTSLGIAFTGEEITAFAQGNAQKPAAKPDDDLKGRTVTFAVIGLGARGREILAALAKIGPQYAKVVSVCDTFSAPNFVKKAQAIAPNAAFEADYRKVLDNKEVEAVFIATPTNKHKQIALDSVAAGKHVYCEAPFSNDIADAKAIAQAGQSAKSVFQAGLQARCNGQAAHIYHFILSQVAGKVVSARAQWHNNTSWRQAWPNPQREEELNWRLHRLTSSGLLGEVGIHQIDTTTWYLRKPPVAVTAYGGIMKYSDDGRDVPDTVQAIVEYPNGVNLVYDASLASSFDDAYELFLGTDAAVMLRDQRGWMFKEPGVGQLGWEVFARKDTMQIGHPENGTGLSIGSGIALVADASKQIALGKTDLMNDPTKSALYQSCVVFMKSVRAGQRVPVQDVTKENPHPPIAPGAAEGYQATVVGIKANEAALEGKRIVFDKEMFAV